MNAKGSWRIPTFMVVISILMISFSLPSLLIPPNHTTSKTLPPAGLEPLSEHVLLVVLDGVPRSVFDDSQTMPFLSSFEEIGVKMEVKTSELTLTGSCVKEIATGRESTPMDAIRNWEVTNELREDPFHFVASRGDSVAFTGFYVWQNLYPESYFTHETAPDFGFSDISMADDYTLQVVDRWYETYEHNLMVAHLGGTDHAAHIHGLESAEYQQRMLSLDSQLNELFLNAPDDWTLLLTSDHGVTKSGGHALGTGGEAEEVYLYAKGAGIDESVNFNEEIQQRDISVLISALMNVPLSASTDAQIPVEVLDLLAFDRARVEAWNWENVRAHHEHALNNGEGGVESLPETPSWELLDSETSDFPIIQFMLSLMVITCILYIFFVKINLEMIKIDTSRNYVIASSLLLGLTFLTTLAARDESFLISARWWRKTLGIFPLLFLVLAMFWQKINLNSSSSNEIPLISVIILVLIVSLPESRYSIILISMSILALVSFSRKEFFGLGINQVVALSSLLMLVCFQLVDYLPRYLFGSSLQTILDIDVLYKPMQRLVLVSSPSNPVGAAIMVFVFTAIFWIKLDEGHFTVEWEKYRFVGFVFFLSVFQNNFFDWILITIILMLSWSVITQKYATHIESLTNFKPQEMVLIAWVVPTWGWFPALVTLFIISVAPNLIEALKSQEPKLSGVNPKITERLAVSMLGLSAIYLVFYSFSLLTTMGILEFNPSKIIVTGGFFGARIDPPILWMALMIFGPPMYAVMLVLHRIRANINLDDLLVLLSTIILSMSAMYWTSLVSIEYFISLSTSGMVYILVFILALVVHTMFHNEQTEQGVLLQ